MRHTLYLNDCYRTITVYGRRVKAGYKVDIGTSDKAKAAAAKFPCLRPVPPVYADREWTERERIFVGKLVEWWKKRPWVSQYRIAKTLQRSAELSHRTYPSVRSKLGEMSWVLGVAYTYRARRKRWTTKGTVEDGRYVRGRHLINGGAPPPGAPVPEDPRMARRRRR